MWILLATYGFITFVSGLFLMILTGVFGMVISIIGLIMLTLSIFINQPKQELPDDVTKKYCVNCIAEIKKIDNICPLCESIQ